MKISVIIIDDDINILQYNIILLYILLFIFICFKIKYSVIGIINFIIVDTIDIIKKYEYESWYKTTVNNANGIWFGNGINDQFSLKLSSKLEEMKKEIPTNFCFVVNRGIPKYVKFIENFEVDDNKIESLW